ncbi:hypothetical protein [Nocardia sp. NPDC050413]|uniref:hypothetical protein n=1 Tax=Nocardia sp. NPDC050413 TaxID=3155784 RepID=UPI0033FD4E19
MFMSNDNNTTAHADGPAVEDEIVRETGRTLGQIMAVARSWMQSRKGRQSGVKPPKLSRKERRELAEAIREQVGEQRIAEAWYTKRVNDYHSEVVAAGLRRHQPGFTAADAENDAARLEGIRYGIESTLHETAVLPLEQRGQVALALNAAQRNPDRPYGAIFKPMDRQQERVARQVAVLSENWVAERREDNARLVAEQRERAAKLAEARREARPPRNYDELDQAQRNAVQALRSAHVDMDRAGNELASEAAEKAREQAIEAARAAGLTRREVGHEIDYMYEHTYYAATYGVPGGVQVTNHYPFREEALSETAREMSWDRRLPRDGTVFVEVGARHDGFAADDVQRRSAMGPRHEAINAVGRWSRESEGVIEYFDTPHEVAVARIEPGTGKVLASEIATVTSEQAALDFAHNSVRSASPDTARMRVEVTDPKHPESPRYSEYGLPGTLSNKLADQRVASREELFRAQLDTYHARTEEYSQEYHSLDRRHRLSIEHNADLTDRNADLTRQLATMIAERDQALAEAKQLRGERDQAVQKLAERTPKAERFGSPERQAAAARETASANAFANAPVNAFAAATERDGMER